MSEKCANPWAVWRDLVILAAAVPLLAAAVHVGWSAAAAAKLDNARARLAATGWDFTAHTIPVPDGDNAADLVRQAAMIAGDGPYRPPLPSLQWDRDIRYPPEWVDMAEAMSTQNAPAFDLVEQAVKRRHLSYTYPPKAQETDRSAPMTHAALISPALSTDAMYLVDNPALALQRIKTLGQLGVVYRTSPSNRLSYMESASSLDAAAADAARFVAATLTSDNTKGPLRAELLDFIRSRFVAAKRPAEVTLNGDLVDLQDSLENRFGGLVRPIGGSILARAMLGLADSRTTAATILPNPTRPPAIKLTLVSFADQYYDALYYMEFFHQVQDYNATYDLTAGLSFAVALFRLDRGRFPATLAELVPDYIPEVPIDPIGVGGVALGYVLAGSGDRPVIFFRGGGMTLPTTLPGEVLVTWFGGRSMVSDLTPHRRPGTPTAPATRTSASPTPPATTVQPMSPPPAPPPPR